MGTNNHRERDDLCAGLDLKAKDGLIWPAECFDVEAAVPEIKHF